MDRNLRYALIDALMEQGDFEIDEDSLDTSDEDYNHPSARAMAKVDRMKISDAKFARVKSLCFDGGNEIYALLWPSWDGESGEFDVSSLEGIEVCKSLETFTVISMFDPKSKVSLRPLASLPNLKRVSLHQSVFTDFAALLECKSLESVVVTDADVKAKADQKAIAQLRKRGLVKAK